MFTIYSEKEIFETIVLFNEQSPNWYNIFCNHAEVCLNMTDEELEKEEVQGTPIFEFIMANGGRCPVALKDFFDEIEEDASAIIKKPRSVFFLNITKAQAKELQDNFGIVVQSSDGIDDSILKGTFFKELPEGIRVESKKKIGWQCLLDFKLPPSNSLIITDDWLFKNKEDSKIVGEYNIINLIDSLLPEKLEIDYHILLITKDQGRSKEKCEQLADNIISRIKSLRKFQINVEIVFAETIHKRKVFLNYMSITCDRGFAMFKIKDNKTVRGDNDFRYEKAFERNLADIGDSVYASDGILMKKIYDKCRSVTEYIKNKCQDPDQRILGDCNPNKLIKNRLLNNI